jgi:hypothetical protein
LVRNSSFTGTDFQPEARSAPRVVGRDAGTSGFVIVRQYRPHPDQFLFATHYFTVFLD